MALSEPATDNDATEMQMEVEQKQETVIEEEKESHSFGPPPFALTTRFHQFPPAVYQSSATLLSSLIFPPYEFVHCDLDDDPDDPDAEPEPEPDPQDLDDPDDCQITGEYQQSEELSSSSEDIVQN